MSKNLKNLFLKDSEKFNKSKESKKSKRNKKGNSFRKDKTFDSKDDDFDEEFYSTPT